MTDAILRVLGNLGPSTFDTLSAAVLVAQTPTLENKLKKTLAQMRKDGQLCYTKRSAKYAGRVRHLWHLPTQIIPKTDYSETRNESHHHEQS